MKSGDPIITGQEFNPFTKVTCKECDWEVCLGQIEKIEKDERGEYDLPSFCPECAKRDICSGYDVSLLPIIDVTNSDRWDDHIDDESEDDGPDDEGTGIPESVNTADEDEGESRPNYGSMWRSSRDDVLDRDDHACRVCGEDDPDGQVQVHHIKPARRFDVKKFERGETMHHEDNLISLCPTCHGTYEGMFQNCSPDEFIQHCQLHETL